MIAARCPEVPPFITRFPANGHSQANLAALRSLGASSVIALNTVGVIAAGQHPGQIAIPDQVIDYTFGRDHSIHDGESDSLDHGGVYAVMQRPQRCRR